MGVLSHGLLLSIFRDMHGFGPKLRVGSFPPMQEASQTVESIISSAGLTTSQAGLLLHMKKLRLTGVDWLAQVEEQGWSDTKPHVLDCLSYCLTCSLGLWKTLAQEFGDFVFWSWQCHSFSMYMWQVLFVPLWISIFSSIKWGKERGLLCEMTFSVLLFIDLMKYTSGPGVYLPLLEYHALSPSLFRDPRPRLILIDRIR